MQILSTKLSIPPLRSRSVTRPRLIQRLNQGLECGFILVSAPAGYGKSTLLSSWLSRFEYPAAWLSLDDSDNDLDRFLTYLEAAFRHVDPGAINPPKNFPTLKHDRDFREYLTPLINQLAQRKDPCCLVLDDYHVIQDQLIHQAVSFLLNHRPQPLIIVIITRADPPLPLARLRARSCLLELRMADLRFTPQEAADFLSHTMGLKIKQEDIDRLTQRTEGWIAGLQIAALSMQKTDDIPGFIRTLTGSHHYIFDYLLEEILAKQSPEVQHFLLSTSILDQFTAPLCDALLKSDTDFTPKQPSSVLLDDLDHANLFIIPVDPDRRCFRFHPLFADLLRGYLKKNNPAKVVALHTYASSWFESQGLIPEAIRHSLSANDWERVIRLISGNIFALLEQNELNNVARQINSLTGESADARPWLLIGRAWLAAYTGQIKTVEPILKLAEREIDRLRSAQDLQSLGGHIAAIRAYINWIADNRVLAAQAARAALEWLPEDERLIRCQAYTLLGLTLDDFDEREKSLILALSYAKEIPASHVTIFAHGCWAWLLAIQGRLRESYAACQEAIRMAEFDGTRQPLPTLSHVYAALSCVLREWNELEESILYGRQAVTLARRWEQADAMHFALDTLGYALFAAGDMSGAYDCLHQAFEVARHTSNWFEQISISQELEWYLMTGNLDAAIQLSRSHMVEIPSPSHVALGEHKSVVLPMAITQLYIARKEFGSALDLSTQLIEEMEKKKLGHFLVRLYLWEAICFYKLKQETKALDCLQLSLTRAVPEGYIRTFTQEGESLIPILLLAQKAGLFPDYINKLLAIIKQAANQQLARLNTTPGLLEALSEREMDVLKLLAQGCSDKKIADTLVIARETVHKHLKNIYSKLDVHSRTEAILRARELSLL